MNVAQNSWILPLRGEQHDTPAVNEQGLRIRAAWEKTPLFEELNRDFWPEHFDTMTDKRLAFMGKRLGLALPEGRTNMIATLTSYFRNLVAPPKETS